MADPAVLVLVKNEEYWLPYCLQSVAPPHFKRFVIYDVGSTDRTRDVIKWFEETYKSKAEIEIRLMPHCDPIIQGTFRNSMIIDGRRPTYLILDGDEIYHPDDIRKIHKASTSLEEAHAISPRQKYGVFSRVEVHPDLKSCYAERRSHHRLYTNDAGWIGTHPGEIPRHNQNSKSELLFDDITVWHMHNTLRSSKEEDVPKRMTRKTQKTYHPGHEMVGFNLLDELPNLRKPIEDFPVCPALADLQGA